MNDFDLSLLGADAALKRGYLSIVNNAGRTVALITLAVAALVTFTDVAFVGEINRNLSCTVIYLLIASYLIYFSMESAGERLGRESEEYREAQSEYRELSKRIKPTDVYALRKFCREYSARELEFRVEGFLLKHGLTREDFEAARGGAKPPLRERLVFFAASRMRPIQLTPKMLLSNDTGAKSELQSPARCKLFSMITRLLPITLSVFFTGAVVLGAKSDLDAVAIIDGIVKLSALPIIAVKGYLSGYEYAKERLTEWLTAKSKLLAEFRSQDASATEASQ